MWAFKTAVSPFRTHTETHSHVFFFFFLQESCKTCSLFFFFCSSRAHERSSSSPKMQSLCRMASFTKIPPSRIQEVSLRLRLHLPARNIALRNTCWVEGPGSCSTSKPSFLGEPIQVSTHVLFLSVWARWMRVKLRPQTQISMGVVTSMRPPGELFSRGMRS